MCSALFATAVELCQSRWRHPRSLTLTSSLSIGRDGVRANTPGLCQSDLHAVKQTFSGLNLKVSKEDPIFIETVYIKKEIVLVCTFQFCFTKIVLEKNALFLFLIKALDRCWVV